MNAVLKEPVKRAVSDKRLATAAQSLRQYRHVGDSMYRSGQRPVTSEDMITGNWRQRAAGIAWSAHEDAEAAVQLLIEHHGEDFEVADDLGNNRPLWAWQYDIAQVDLELQPWKTALKEWLQLEATKRAAVRKLEATAEKRDEGERAAKAAQMKIERLRLAREAKERADRALAEAEAAAEGAAIA